MRRRENMRFYKHIWNEENKFPKKYPCVIVENNGWDDFGYKTTFQIYYCKSSFTTKKLLGTTKILAKECFKTVERMPREFNNGLSDEFCSLGQSLNFYRNLADLDREVASEILSGLNDIIFKDRAYQNYKDEMGFKISLLRTGEANRIVEERDSILEKLDFLTVKSFCFTYVKQLEGALKPHEVKFNFEKKGILPNRVIGIVGKNGCGKTQILSNMAKDIMLHKVNNFKEKTIPMFSKIIAVSYSAFDMFYNPHDDRKLDGILDESGNRVPTNQLFNYIYCGIRSSNTILSMDEMKSKLSESLHIIEKNKEQKNGEL